MELTVVYDGLVFGEWISNVPNPNNHDLSDEHVDWLKDKILGPPRATDFYTRAELEGIGMVGVYVAVPLDCI